jgi:GPH family glycoside/pentoside/hexuronide:cation symporter
MLPDILEVDELMSGKRQEGVYSGVNVFVRKLSTGIVLGLIGPLMAWSGYQEGADVQPDSAITTIRLLISLAPAALLVMACVVAWFYPMTRERHTAIRAELDRRRSRID